MLDEGHKYLRFLNIDRPIYNLHLDNLTNLDTDLLHEDSTFTFSVDLTDEANAALSRFGSWEVAIRAGPYPHDQPGSDRRRRYPDPAGERLQQRLCTVPGEFLHHRDHGQHAAAAADLPAAAGGALAGVRRRLSAAARSGLWQRRWLAGNLCDRAAALALGGILAAFVVVVPFWQPGNTGLATEHYNTAYWDGESTVSFVYQQYGALAHSLLNGRLDLEEDPPPELAAMENPYDATARDALNIQGGRWDHAYYNGRYYVYFGIVPCLCSSFPSRPSPGSRTCPMRPAW